jgi:hypothetical protein
MSYKGSFVQRHPSACAAILHARDQPRVGFRFHHGTGITQPTPGKGRPQSRQELLDARKGQTHFLFFVFFRSGNIAIRPFVALNSSPSP